MHDEGFRVYRYSDSMDIPTIGVGFNLTRPDWQHGLVAAGVPFSDCMSVKSGAKPLTLGQVTALLTYSDEPVIPQCRAALDPTHFDSMSDARRCAFANIDFNVGYGTLESFTGFRAFINDACHFAAHSQPIAAHASFGKAADHLLTYAYAEQVGARAKRNAEMFRTSNYVSVAAFE